MPQRRHYSPVIDRFLVSVLYFDARHHGLPMTRRVNELLRKSLEGSAAWDEARESWSQRKMTACPGSGARRSFTAVLHFQSQPVT